MATSECRRVRHADASLRAAGLDEVTAGKVFIEGTELGSLSERQLTRLRRDRVGFVFQAFNLVPTLTAHENITLPMALVGRAPDMRWVDHVDTVDLRAWLEHRPAQLSGGQQQRVAVAGALASRPAIIFADEPTGNLDSRSSADILTFMRRAVDELEQTIVMVTHDPRRGVVRPPRAVPRRRPHRRRDARSQPRRRARPHQGPRQSATRAKQARPDVLKLAPGPKGPLGRYLLTFLAVTIGVTFVAGVITLTDTIARTLDDLYAGSNPGTDVAVRGDGQFKLAPELGGATQRPRIAADLAEDVDEVDGVAAAEAYLQGYTRPIAPDGSPIGNPTFGAPTIGTNWGEVDDLNPFDIAEGRPPGGEEIVFDKRTTDKTGYQVGDIATVQTATGDCN